MANEKQKPNMHIKTETIDLPDTKKEAHSIKLSRQETNVLTLAAGGKTYPEISKLLRMSEDTAREHVDRVRYKLDAVNKTHAVAVAMSLGLIKL